MTFTVHFSWWAVPAAVTLLALLSAIFWPSEDSGGGWLPDITPLFRLVPASLVSALAWAIAGALK